MDYSTKSFAELKKLMTEMNIKNRSKITTKQAMIEALTGASNDYHENTTEIDTEVSTPVIASVAVTPRKTRSYKVDAEATKLVINELLNVFEEKAMIANIFNNDMLEEWNDLKNKVLSKFEKEKKTKKTSEKEKKTKKTSDKEKKTKKTSEKEKKTKKTSEKKEKKTKKTSKKEEKEEEVVNKIEEIVLDNAAVVPDVEIKEDVDEPLYEPIYVRAGLTYNVDEILEQYRVNTEVAIATAAALEGLALEVMDIAGSNAAKDSRDRITTADIISALEEDEELNHINHQIEDDEYTPFIQSLNHDDVLKQYDADMDLSSNGALCLSKWLTYFFKELIKMKNVDDVITKLQEELSESETILKIIIKRVNLSLNKYNRE